MAQIIIRNLPEPVPLVLDEIAKNARMSREAYIRQMLVDEANIARILVIVNGKLDIKSSAQAFATANYTYTQLAEDIRLWANDTFTDNESDTYKARQGLLIMQAVWAGQPSDQRCDVDELDQAFIAGFGNGTRQAIKARNKNFGLVLAPSGAPG